MVGDGELRITKIKYDGKKVRIEYERGRPEGEPDEFVLGCFDRPSRAFTDALQALGRDVNEICEFDPPQTITVRSVSFSWTNDVMGACITGQKSLKTANSPLVITTPHLPSQPYSETGGEPLLDPDCIVRLKQLIEEGCRYILGGSREQPNLLRPEGATS